MYIALIPRRVVSVSRRIPSGKVTRKYGGFCRNRWGHVLALLCGVGRQREFLWSRAATDLHGPGFVGWCPWLATIVRHAGTSNGNGDVLCTIFFVGGGWRSLGALPRVKMRGCSFSAKRVAVQEVVVFVSLAQEMMGSPSRGTLQNCFSVRLPG